MLKTWQPGPGQNATIPDWPIQVVEGVVAHPGTTTRVKVVSGKTDILPSQIFMDQLLTSLVGNMLLEQRSRSGHSNANQATWMHNTLNKQVAYLKCK